LRARGEESADRERRHQVQLAEQQQQEQQQLGPIQVETVDEDEEIGAGNEPLMVTNPVFVDPDEETVLPSLHSILEKTGTNKFDPSNIELYAHVEIINAVQEVA
jgi:hypothetical protein